MQPSLRAQVAQHGAVPQGPVTAGHTIAASPREEEGSAAGEGEVCLPRVPADGLCPVSVIIPPQHSALAHALAPATRSSDISIYPRARPLTRN